MSEGNAAARAKTSTAKTSAMIASIAAEGQRTVAAPFGHALAELAREKPGIVGMSADLARYADLHVFAEEHPDRFYQMGMAEQLLMAGTGMAREDLAIFRGMPGLTIVDPCDAIDIQGAVPAIGGHRGPVYMRLPRGKVPAVLDEYGDRFEPGAAVLLRSGCGAVPTLHDRYGVSAAAVAGRVREWPGR